jgi:carboxymethylenebutenolidase
MQLTDIQITDELKGVLAVPAGKGPFAAVVMVHEVFGVDAVMRTQIERLASAGYIVLMPDLFSRGGARKCLTATFKSLTSGTGQAFEDIEAAKNLLLAREDSNGKVGVIGFCMGGAFALMLANRGYQASSVNYGQLPKDLDAVLAGACPIIGSFGGKDTSLKGAAAKLEAATVKASVVHDIKEYPEAGHAFMNEVQAGPWWLKPVLTKVAGVKSDPEAAKDAWSRIEDFFAEHLR